MTQKRTQHEFEELVKEISNDQYTVLGNYVDALTKLHIVCNICGYRFQMRPSLFLEGGRCKMCKKLKKLNLFDFVVNRRPLFRLLIVDDDLKVLEFCKNVLVEAEFDVDTTNDGAKALKMYEKNPYDLMLVDLLMPSVDGVQILVRLKEKFSNYNVVVMSETANYPAEFKNFFISTKMIGATDTLEKPFTKEILIDKVVTILQKASYKR